MIRALGEDVRSLLRSGIAVSSLTQCIDELVLNSLDASATCITVRVNIPSLQVQVSDNGTGISRDSLNALGERYATSKCHSLTDLNDIKSYGFRGEALASIRDIAGSLEIVTRHKASYKTYCKTFVSNKAVEITESCIPRSGVGTTVTVYDLFFSLPVRRKLVSDVLDFERIRQRVASIALINPGVSFSLFNDATGQKSLQTRKSQSITSTFSQLFGNLKAKSLQELSLECGDLGISGYVGLQTHHSKHLQFVYINGRLLMKTRIHKLINQILNRSSLIKKPSLSMNDNDESSTTKSPPKQGCDKYGIYVLNLTCSVINYDITLEPSKTLVEFEDWDSVLELVKKCIESFLVKANLILSGDTTEDSIESLDSSSDSQIDLSVYEYQAEATTAKHDYSINPDNIRKSLQSSVVSRRTNNNSDNLTDEIEMLDKAQLSPMEANISHRERDRREALSSTNQPGSQESLPGKVPRNASQLDNCFTSKNPITLKSQKQSLSGRTKRFSGITKHHNHTSLTQIHSRIHSHSPDSQSKSEIIPTKKCFQIINDDKIMNKEGGDCMPNCYSTNKQCIVDDNDVHDNNIIHDDVILTSAPDISDGELEKVMKDHEDIITEQGELPTVLSFTSDINEIDDMPSSLCKDWQVTFDNNLKKNIYYNVRNGNTIFECPANEQANQDKYKKSIVPLVCAPHLSFDCTPWLPRDDRQRRTTIVESLGSEEQPASLLSTMLTEWENPVFEAVSEMDVTKFSKPTVARTPLHKAVLSYRFTKEMVKTLQVIQQVDNKFIICQVQGDADHDSLVVLLDQHAVHERIRVEKLTEDLFITKSQTDGRLPSIKSYAVSPPIELGFTPHDLLLIKRFRRELGRVGIKFVVGCCSESSEPRSIIIHELPGVFVEREVSETRRQRPSVAEAIVKELVESHIEHLKQTNGVPPVIPKTILRVLSSQACHGAIKFGDGLTKDECERLIHQLSACDLPFQCAHGRPSIIPLVDLKLLESRNQQSKVEAKLPKLSKLSSVMGQ